MADPASLSDRFEQRLCYYINLTSQIQLARLVDSSKVGLRQIVFPRQRWLFEALPEAWLEIGSATQLLPERISCLDLQVKEGISILSADSDSVVE